MFVETVSVERRASGLLPLDTLCGTINAHIAAGNKATTKAEEHYKAAGLLLLEAKKRLPIESPGTTFSAYLVGQCNMHTSRAYELIAIAEGRTTQAEIRKGYAERNARRNGGAGVRVHGQGLKAQQQRENIEAAQNQEYAPRKYANIAPDPRLKIIGQITLKTRDANLSELKIVDDFFAKLLSKRRADSLN
jgi:hypothetical protein